MIIEFEDISTSTSAGYWAYRWQRGLLDQRYDRSVGRGPAVSPGLWYAYGTGRPMPVKASVRLTLARGVPVDSGPTSEADARARYSDLLALLLPGAGYRLWICSNDGTRLWGRELYGARRARLVTTPSQGWWEVEAELEVRAGYTLTGGLVTDTGDHLVTDTGDRLVYVEVH